MLKNSARRAIHRNWNHFRRRDHDIIDHHMLWFVQSHVGHQSVRKSCSSCGLFEYRTGFWWLLKGLSKQAFLLLCCKLENKLESCLGAVRVDCLPACDFSSQSDRQSEHWRDWRKTLLNYDYNDITLSEFIFSLSLFHNHCSIGWHYLH